MRSVVAGRSPFELCKIWAHLGHPSDLSVFGRGLARAGDVTGLQIQPSKDADPDLNILQHFANNTDLEYTLRDFDTHLHFILLQEFFLVHQTPRFEKTLLYREQYCKSVFNMFLVMFCCSGKCSVIHFTDPFLDHCPNCNATRQFTNRSANGCKSNQ